MTSAECEKMQRIYKRLQYQDHTSLSPQLCGTGKTNSDHLIILKDVAFMIIFQVQKTEKEI